MNIIPCVGYIKSGNIFLAEPLNFAAGIFDLSHDIYQIKSQELVPSFNPIFKDPTYCIKTHVSWRDSVDIQSLYFGLIFRIIAISRNLLDTLPSSINPFVPFISLQGICFLPFSCNHSKAYFLVFMPIRTF